MFDIGPDHGDARRQATIDFGDVGAGHSVIEYYKGAKPSPGAAATGGTLLAVMVLTKPCGTVVAGKIVLTQEDTTGDLIMAGGTATWGRWKNGNGDFMGDGDVSDDTGTGFFKVAGTAGTVLYAGARVILGAVEIA